MGARAFSASARRTAILRKHPLYALQPKAHVQCLGPLCLSWYALREGEGDYRPLAHRLTLGPDLARPLHRVWAAIEAHAERLDRLCRQQAAVRFDVVAGERRKCSGCDRAVGGESGRGVRVLLTEKDTRYYVVHDGEVLSAESSETRVDRGVYLLLAELADGE